MKKTKTIKCGTDYTDLTMSHDVLTILQPNKSLKRGYDVIVLAPSEVRELKQFLEV